MWAWQMRPKLVQKDKDQKASCYTARRWENVLFQQWPPSAIHSALISVGGQLSFVSMEPPLSLSWGRKWSNHSHLNEAHLLTNLEQHPIQKSNSCPSIVICNSQRQPYSSSSSTSTSSSSSPPPIRTSAITGPDPHGWRLRPKSSSAYRHTKRLSLQIPLPVIAPDPKSRPATNPQRDNDLNPDRSLKRKPPLGPKSSRRRHSDSSTFLTSLISPQVEVTVDELRALHLRRVTLPDESDDVFGRANKEELKVTTRPRKIPPPVPEKTPSTRKKAQLIAHSHQSCWVNEEIIWVTKPKHFYQRKGETQNGKHENTAIVTPVQEH